LLVAGIRVLSWPLTGLFVDAYALAILVAGLVLGALAWCRSAARGPTRTLVAWLAATLGWSWLVLALAVPGLATVVRQLPVDHYHAFLDPLVVAIVATTAAAILERAGAPSIARLAATVVVAGLLAWNVATQPPLISPDGGWPAAQRAATRVEAIAHGKPVAVLELPTFKGPDTYVFPLVRDGANVVATAAAVPAGGYVAVVCEDAYRDAIGQACEGRAEDAAIGTVVRVPRLVERFLASPGRHLSVYAVDR
jgi:hypothetical protein